MERHHWQVWLIGVIGLWLMVSPFVLGVPVGEDAGAGAFRWSFVGPGSVLVLLAVTAMLASQTWEAGLAAPIGVWLILSPWILSYTAFPSAVWSAVASGAAILLLGIWSLVTDRSGRLG
jgi:hypothetical protein